MLKLENDFHRQYAIHFVMRVRHYASTFVHEYASTRVCFSWKITSTDISYTIHFVTQVCQYTSTSVCEYTNTPVLCEFAKIEKGLQQAIHRSLCYGSMRDASTPVRKYQLRTNLEPLGTTLNKLGTT